MGGRVGRAFMVAALVAGVAGTPEAAPACRELSLAARRAYLDHEYSACAETLRALREILPGHPGLTYLLARCEGRLGHREGAVAALHAYAATGLMQDVGRDSAFAGRWADSSFVRIAEQLKANAAPRSLGKVIHQFSDPNLLVEDVAWDPGTRSDAASRPPVLQELPLDQ